MKTLTKPSEANTSGIAAGGKLVQLTCAEKEKSTEKILEGMTISESLYLGEGGAVFRPLPRVS